MTIPVELPDLGECIDEYGPVAFLATVDELSRSHLVAVRARLEAGTLVLRAGKRTRSYAAARPAVALLWPAPPGCAYSLIVDGEAHVRGGADEPGGPITVLPIAAILHAMPSEETSERLLPGQAHPAAEPPPDPGSGRSPVVAPNP
jgi:hypothetical protein